MSVASVEPVASLLTGTGDCSDSRQQVLAQECFRVVLMREECRAERSNETLAVLSVRLNERARADVSVQEALILSLSSVKRDSDILGWLECGQELGLVLTGGAATSISGSAVELRLRGELARRLPLQTLEDISLRLHVHGASDDIRKAGPTVAERHPRTRRRRLLDVTKRGVDIVGASTLLLLLSPVLAVIALAVKLGSHGPVLFKQVRVGQMMMPFTMLKFRTMYAGVDHAVHQRYVTEFIQSGGGTRREGEVFKLTSDPRVTVLGRLLRKTSLDELPQLWNVLRGDMSLVGPRPPLPYEVQQYKAWHRRRMFEAKPGITGLWQVTGRSRTTFDEMVRLDIRYARTRSLATDLKILLATPAAVISGKGAC